MQVQTEIQLGISYISSFLKAQGYNTDLIVLAKGTKNKFIDKYINELNPNLICFTATASEYDFIAETAKYIKSHYPFIYLLVGGPHISLNPERAIKGYFDSVCIGEGEFPVLKLVQQLERGEEPNKINNLWIKHGTKVEKNKTSDFIQNLDSFPLPDRDMWQKWIKYPETMHPILLGRGCPFRCSYCSNHALSKIASGKYVRYRTVENVIEEIKDVITKFPKTVAIYFEVETVGVNIGYDIIFCSELEKINKAFKKLTYGVNLRVIPGVDYSRLFKAFKTANFKFVNIGLESGSQRVREEILRRHYSNDDIINTVSLAKNIGLKVRMPVMVGIPGETLEDFKETIKCCRQCQADEYQLSIYFPYPGTDLYDYSKEKGLLPPKIKIMMERTKPVLDMPDFPKSEIQKQYIWFYYNVYKGYKPLHVLLKKVIMRAISTNFIYGKLRRYTFVKKIEEKIDILLNVKYN